MRQKILSGLNEFQREAVEAHTGPLLVLAGAGSGKTKVITHKIAYLLEVMGVSPKNILAVTFTNKAAREMKERVQGFLGKNRAKGLTLSTFHSLGVMFLKQEIEKLGYLPQFSIYSDSDTEGVIKGILMDLGLDDKQYPPKMLASLIGRAKNELKSPAQVSKLEDTAFRQVYEIYQERLKTLNAVDFDDLIYLPVKMLQAMPEVREKWAGRFHYLLVDEYQDTNHSQYTLMKLISSVHGNICVVGDDDQSIYAFRGADVDNILRFEKEFPGARVITLGINYRSTQTIIEAAYALIGHNARRHSKEVRGEKRGGKKIQVFEALDAEEEADRIADEIFENRLTYQIPYHEQAVLCRTNTQMKAFEESFRRKNIPYRLIGGFSFFDRKEVKDVVSYLKLFVNPYDNLALLRVINFPRRGIGDKAVEVLTAFAQAQSFSLFEALARVDHIPELSKPAAHKMGLFKELIDQFKTRFEKPGMARTLDEFFQESGLIQEYERLYDNKESAFRLSSLESLKAMAQKFEQKNRQEGDYSSLEDFLKDLSLFNQDDGEDEKDIQNKAVIMTIHSAKGLEFQSVFLPGFEEKTLPHDRSIEEGPKAIEEERRLAYVAITRAKSKLFISYCSQRKTYGREEERDPSRFLKEIPPRLLDGTGGVFEEEPGKSKEESEEDFFQKLRERNSRLS